MTVRDQFFFIGGYVFYILDAVTNACNFQAVCLNKSIAATVMSVHLSCSGLI